MKATLVLLVAALGFYASVAWAADPAAGIDKVVRTPSVQRVADRAASGHAQRAGAAPARPTSRPLAVPDFETGARSAPSVLCACVRDRHSA